MKRRSVLLVAPATALLGLAGCAGPRIEEMAQELPRLDLRQYFNGMIDAWGIFTDRNGKVVKRFTVVMDCRWSGEEGVLDEQFSYSDGTQQRRIAAQRATRRVRAARGR